MNDRPYSRVRTGAAADLLAESSALKVQADIMITS